MLLAVALLVRTCITPAPPLNLPVWPASGERLEKLLQRSGNTYINKDISELILIAPNDSGVNQVLHFPLHNQVSPRLSALISKETGGVYKYTYTVSNGKGATDSILAFSLVVPREYDSRIPTADGINGVKGWSGGVAAFAVIAPQCEIPANKLGRYLSWVASRPAFMIQPGAHLSNFSINSQLSPGFTTVYATGPFLQVSETVGDFDLQIVSNRRWGEQHVPAIGPMFSSPYSCADVIDNYKSGINRLLEQWPPSTEDKEGLLSLYSKLANGPTCEALQNFIASHPLSERQPITSEITNALGLALSALSN